MPNSLSLDPLENFNIDLGNQTDWKAASGLLALSRSELKISQAFPASASPGDLLGPFRVRVQNDLSLTTPLSVSVTATNATIQYDYEDTGFLSIFVVAIQNKTFTVTITDGDCSFTSPPISYTCPLQVHQDLVGHLVASRRTMFKTVIVRATPGSSIKWSAHQTQSGGLLDVIVEKEDTLVGSSGLASFTFRVPTVCKSMYVRATSGPVSVATSPIRVWSKPPKQIKACSEKARKRKKSPITKADHPTLDRLRKLVRDIQGQPALAAEMTDLLDSLQNS